MKSPAKKKIKKTKAKVKAKITPIQKAKNSVSAVAKQLAAHNKKHTAVVTRVNKAKAKIAVKATAAAKKALAAARVQANASRKQASALRDSLKTAKSDFKVVEVKQKFAAAESAAKTAILNAEKRLQNIQAVGSILEIYCR